MSEQTMLTTTCHAAGARPTGMRARLGTLPPLSWVIGERGAAGYGVGSGVMGGACCIGGAAITAAGLASSAAVGSFISGATPYFIGASVVMMAVWFLRMARRMRFNVRAMAPMLARHAVIMGVIYAAILMGSMALAAATGIRM